jgi:MFS transporter, DHA1 family, multidrug resistance protein
MIRQWDFWLIVVRAWIVIFAVDSAFPLLPDIANLFGTSKSYLQALSAVEQIVFAIAILISFRLTNRVGPRRALFTTTGLFGVAQLCSSASPNLLTFAVLQVIAFAAAAASYSAAISMLRATFPDRFVEARAYYGSLVTLAPVCAPVIGSTIAAYSGWRPVFLVGGIAGLAFSLLGLAKTGDRATTKEKKAGLNELIRVIQDPEIRSIMARLGSLQAVTALLVISLPFFLAQTYSLSVSPRGLIVAALSSAVIIASLVCARLVKAHGSEPASKLGYAIFALCLLANMAWLLQTGFAFILASVLCAQVAMAFLVPVLYGRATSTNVTNKDAVISLLVFAQTAFWAAGNGIASLISVGARELLFGTTALLILGPALLSRWPSAKPLQDTLSK